jgi:RNA polymerase sigma factor (sigma-70 family)
MKKKKDSNINIKMEAAMKDSDITNIMHKASGKFIRSLDTDTLYTCEINALWKSLVNFKPEKKTKFTTYLYKGVVIECLKALKFENKNCSNNRELHDNLSSKRHSPNLIFELLDELDTDEEKMLITDKFSNMTIQEMANTRTYSRETVRKKLKKLYNKLRESLD